MYMYDPVLTGIHSLAHTTKRTHINSYFRSCTATLPYNIFSLICSFIRSPSLSYIAHLSLSCAHKFSLFLSPFLSCSLSFSLSLFLTNRTKKRLDGTVSRYCQSSTHALTPLLTNTITLSLFLSRSLFVSYSLSLSLACPFSLTHTHACTRIHIHTHIHTNTLTHTRTLTNMGVCVQTHSLSLLCCFSHARARALCLSFFYSENEKEAAIELGFTLLTLNEVGLRRVHQNTLFYMPHCGR